MKLHALTVLAVGFFVAAGGGAQDESAKKELKKLEGTWVMVAGEEKGEALPEKTVKSAKLSITGDKHTVKVGEDTIIGTHKVDPTKSPKQIDTMDTEGPFKGKKTLGIYKVEKGQFTVCFAPPDKDRPKEFTTKSGTGTILHTWKRQKQ
jgi:uncharacterized protein (TIGR03067 family)